MAVGVKFAQRLERMEEAFRALELAPHARKTVKIIREVDEDDATFAVKQAAEAARLGIDPDRIRWWVRRIVEPSGVPIETEQ